MPDPEIPSPEPATPQPEYAPAETPQEIPNTPPAPDLPDGRPHDQRSPAAETRAIAVAEPPIKEP